MLTVFQMQETERRAFAAGISAETLMEEAGARMTSALLQFSPAAGRCLVVFGKGHNGGDALVCARLLSEAGWRVTLVPAFERPHWAPLTEKKWTQAGLCETQGDPALVENLARTEKGPFLILDGLLGIGARGPLREPVANWCRLLNRWRAHLGARVAALDIPTGLDADTGAADPDALRADWTLTVCCAKPGLVADGAEQNVGRLAVVPLPALMQYAPPMPPEAPSIASAERLAPLLPRRSAHIHKGDCGRVLLVAGNTGTVGAACLSARGALRAGAGLVTLCVPAAIYGLAASRAPEECMVLPFTQSREILALRSDSLGIGPGLGTHPSIIETVLELVTSYPGSAVVDADALNAIATHPAALSACSGPRLLTPHAGEMLRLFAEAQHGNRFETGCEFTRRHPVTLLLKGARTLVCERGRVCFINPTGNPGMASGGMGDVLTGVCATLLAQGMSASNTGTLAAWLCGRSAEMLVYSRARSEESLLASDVADNLGAAIEDLRRGAF